MAEQTNTLNGKMGKCLLRNWVEERSVEVLDEDRQNRGHKGIIAVDHNVKMETFTTSRADYRPVKNPGVRLKGVRRELLEKHLTQMIRNKDHCLERVGGNPSNIVWSGEEVRAERNPLPPKAEFSSTTSKDFCAQGFLPCRPHTTKAHDYRTDQAVTFWSENHRRIQGVTPIQNMKAPFRKSTLFSTPITERLDEADPPSDD